MNEPKPPFIRNVEHPFTSNAGSLIKIQIRADWPTPAWEHSETSIEVDDIDKIVSIQYLGLRRAGVALQQITSFDAEIEITLKSKGVWKLLVISRSENWESIITVR